MRLKRFLLAALALWGCASPAGAAVTLLIDGALELPAPARLGESVSVLNYRAETLSDPILRGRLLAKLKRASHIVVVGLESAEWVASEIEGQPVHFEGGVTRVSGPTLSRQAWTGSAAYQAEQIMAAAGAAGWRRIAAFYTPGYEPLLERVKQAAGRRQITIEPVAILARKDIPPRAKSAFESNDAVFVLGDPLLTRGAGSDFLIESSLAGRQPLIAPEPALVGQGAFIAAQPNWSDALNRAADYAHSLEGKEHPPAALSDSPFAGNLVVNEVLARKWGIRLPASR